MGNRLSKIYTRTGDDGSTGLGDGSRVAKDSLRVEAYGTVDEANSCIGLVLASEVPEDIRTLLTSVQHQIDHLNGILFIDHLSRLKRDRVLKKFQKQAKLKSAGQSTPTYL